MGVKNVSNSKSDLQGHSRALAMLLFGRPHMISCQCSVATVSFLAPFPRYYHLFPKIYRSVLLNTSHGGNRSFMHQFTSVSITRRHLKYIASSIPKMWLGQNKKTDRVTLTTPLFKCRMSPICWVCAQKVSPLAYRTVSVRVRLVWFVSTNTSCVKCRHLPTLCI